MKKSVILAVSLLAAVALGVGAWLIFSPGSDEDPNRDYVTSICQRAAAVRPPFFGEEPKTFVAERVTHEERDSLLHYRAVGRVTKSDGFGGEVSYTFDCKAQLATTGQRGEVTDITVRS